MGIEGTVLLIRFSGERFLGSAAPALLALATNEIGDQGIRETVLLIRDRGQFVIFPLNNLAE